MRMKTTRKAIVENYYCVSVDYCGLQNLLYYADSQYYTAGVYGWNFDVYTFEYKGCNIAICTGYRGMPGKSVPYDTVHEFDTEAKKIRCDNEENKKERLDSLIQEFLFVAFHEL